MVFQNKKFASFSAIISTVCFCMFLASFMVLFYPTIVKLIDSWEVDPNYSHGFFIPLISLYLVYSEKQKLKTVPISYSVRGLFIVTIGLILFLFTWIASLDFGQVFSMVIIIYGGVEYLLGREVANICRFPILYLIFMIPLPAIVWNRLSVPLALVASAISTKIMEFLGLVVFRQGNVITLPNITLEVVQACSGLRSLVTLMALGAAMAYLSTLRLSRKILLFFFSIPIAVIGNVVRLTLTGVLADNFGRKMAQGFIHEFSGWLVFVVGFSLLFFIQRLLEKRSYA